MPDVIGIDHIYLTVSNLERAAQFYDKLLIHCLGFRKNQFSLNNEAHIQYFNRHFGIVLRPARQLLAHQAYAPGLHHLCLRVETAEEVEQLVQQLQQLGITASAAERYPDYAPDYVATFLQDPDGIELEITNYRQERRARHDHWEQLA